jgi:hypothetical protein
MLEWDLYVDHTTIYRWVQRYASELEKRCLQYIEDLIGGIMRLMWGKHLHWEPRVPVREGFMRTVNYCREALRPPSEGGV